MPRGKVKSRLPSPLLSTAGESRPSPGKYNRTVWQPSSPPTEAQPSSQPQAAVSSSSIAYPWNVPPRIREAGFHEYPIDSDKPPPDGDIGALQPPAQQLQDDNQVLPEIVGDSPDRVDSSATYQHPHAISVPALDHLPISSTHKLTTSVASTLGRSSRPDPDQVAPHLSPRPWLGFFSRHASNPRTVAQKNKLRYTAKRPNTQVAPQELLQQHPNQGGALSLQLLSPLTVNTTTTSPLAPRPVIATPADVAGTLDVSTREAGCCARFWSCICCVSTTRSSDIQ